VFRFWAPEHVGAVWAHTDPANAWQAFATYRDGLRWRHTAANGAAVTVDLQRRPMAADEAVLAITAKVVNGSRALLDGVGIANCLQFAMAPDFSCDDMTRIFVRCAGRWRPLAELEPASDYPRFPAVKRGASGGRMIWGGDLSHLFESTAVDHPLIICASRDGSRCVGTASADVDYLFYNRANPHLLCIHSTQAIQDAVPAKATVEFVQHVYFVNDGVEACASLYDRLPPAAG